jgi:hypothetical protein
MDLAFMNFKNLFISFYSKLFYFIGLSFEKLLKILEKYLCFLLDEVSNTFIVDEFSGEIPKMN